MIIGALVLIVAIILIGIVKLKRVRIERTSERAEAGAQIRHAADGIKKSTATILSTIQSWSRNLTSNIADRTAVGVFVGICNLPIILVSGSFYRGVLIVALLFTFRPIPASKAMQQVLMGNAILSTAFILLLTRLTLNYDWTETGHFFIWHTLALLISLWLMKKMRIKLCQL